MAEVDTGGIDRAQVRLNQDPFPGRGPQLEPGIGGLWGSYFPISWKILKVETEETWTTGHRSSRHRAQSFHSRSSPALAPVLHEALLLPGPCFPEL